MATTPCTMYMYYELHACIWTDAEESRAGLEEMTLLLTVAVFLVSCPAEVVLPSTLLTPCVDIFRQSWESSQSQVWPHVLSITVLVQVAAKDL